MEMTPAVTRALEAAQRWALFESSDQVLPFHLLWGLLEEDEGRAVTLLVQSQMDYQGLLESLTVPEGVLESAVPLPMARRSRAALSLARELASFLSAEQAISSECLLLSLLREEGELRQRLEGHGLDFSRLEGLIGAVQGEQLEMEEPLCLGESVERMGTMRILDANANRAREAIRVVEDYCRFVLDDAFLSSQMKDLRHGLAGALSYVRVQDLLAGRDTTGDVGQVISTRSEGDRGSLKDVALANLKRLQEALRALEEHGKILSRDMAKEIELLRYQSYTLERAVLMGADARGRMATAAIQVLITGSHCRLPLERTVREAVAGGADAIQLREKKLPDAELIERAREVRRWTRDLGALFILNDRPDIARLVEADGVHLGQEDLPVREVRRLLGSEMLIGLSTHSLDQVRQAVLEGVSYIGVGPTFPSGTKGFAELAGLDFVREATEETSLPAFVIGGVNLKTLPDAIAAGATRIAVSQAVCEAEEPRAIVQEMARLLQKRVS